MTSPSVAEKKKFITLASKTFGLTEDEVVKLLREKFESFNPAATSTYLAYLNTIAQDKWLKAFEERRENDHPKYMKQCPYHPDAIVKQDLGWYDKNNKMVAFICEEGDRRCYLRWKMDEMFKAIGREPIDWDEFDANKEIIIKKKLEEA